MKQAKRIIPVIILLVFVLAGCDINRSDNSGDIAPADQPVAGVTPETPAGEAPGETTPTESVPAAGETPPDVAGGGPADISTELFPAAQAPEAVPIEGKVLVKLEQQAAIQARSAELGADQVVAAGLPTLDERLQQIGASELVPVVEDVAEATGDTIESFSVQAEETVQLYSLTYSADLPPEEVAALLEQDPTVEYAEPDYPAGITASPVYLPAPLEVNDPYLKYQWNLPAIQAAAAWDVSTGEGITVAIIDTGIDFRAPDLANTQHLPGFDFANNDADPTDDQGHGTHVAGTVAQSTNNGTGVAGVAFNARLLPIKVLGSDGQGSYEAIIQGLYYAVDQGAKVINMSLAGKAGSQSLQEAVAFAHSKGVVVVAAAGNSNSSIEFPAAYDESVIAVGATNFSNVRSPYSNFGPQIDIVAPGGDVGVDQNGDGYGDGIIQQTFKTGSQTYTYLFFEGTSMASPHVAGVAALMLSRQPNASPDEIRDTILRTALNLGPTEQFGAGLIQARAAIDALAGTSPIGGSTETPTPTSTQTPTETSTPTSTFTPTPTFTGEPIDEHDGDLVTPGPEPITPTSTPTSPDVPSVSGDNLLTNGDFESDQGWEFGDTPLRGSYAGEVVLNGSRSASLGSTERNAYSFSSIWQPVTLPAEASQVTLTANIYPIGPDQGGSDVQFIAVLDSRFRVIRQLSVGLSNAQAWERRSFDLSDLRGQSIYLYFSVFNDGQGSPSTMYVDDVSLNWTR